MGNRGASAIGAALLLLVATAWSRGDEPKRAEEVYKAIQVFRGAPSTDIMTTMMFMNTALGVECAHCHVNTQWDQEMPVKQTAREMVLMMRTLNATRPPGRPAVTCYTCHQGQAIPRSVPPATRIRRAPVAAMPTPTVDEILDRYVQALGGREAIDLVTTRVRIGAVLTDFGPVSILECYEKGLDRSLTITSAKSTVGVSSVGVGPHGGWQQDPKGVRDMSAEDLSRARRELLLLRGVNLRAAYTTLTLAGREPVGESEAWVLDATADHAPRERLSFDTRTGLLVRRLVLPETLVGPYPEQTDFEDYRAVDGVLVPFTIRWARPNQALTRKFLEIRHNAPIDDARFERPAPGPRS